MNHIDYETNYSQSQAAAIEAEDVPQPQTRQQQETGGLPGIIAIRIARFLGNHVDPKGLGWVSGADTEYKWPGLATPRKPDAAFVSIEKLKLPDRDAIPVAPDLAVEVFSKTDSPYDMADKVLEYLAAGVRLVWVVNPAIRQIEVYKTGDTEPSQVLKIDGELSGKPVLPDLTIKISDIFEGIPAAAQLPKSAKLLMAEMEPAEK